MTSAAPMEAYAGIAPFYDRILGRAGFAPIWSMFVRACRRFGFGWDRYGAADFACGTGLFLEALASRGPESAPLFGVDRSADMLAVARRRLAQSPNVVLIRADIGDARLPHRVDLISCNFNSLNYITTLQELDKTMENFSRNLRFNGHVVFDTLVSGGKGIVTPFSQRITLPSFQGHWRITPRPDDKGSRTAMLNRTTSRGHTQQIWVEEHVQRWWSIPALVRALARHGLMCLAVTAVEGKECRARWVQIVARRR